MWGAGRTRARWIAAAGLVLAAGLFTATHGDVGWDGLWVLQVVSRMGAGEVLYRDVFAGVPPLAFFAASAVTRVLGVELSALRLLLVAVLALSYLAAADLLARVTGTRRYDLALAPMMAVWALPANVPLYQPLANLFLIASIDAAAWWCERSEHRRPLPAMPLWIAGAAAGLSFVSKQTVGACAMAGVAVIVLAEHRRRGGLLAGTAISWAWCGAAFALAAGAVLVPVAVSGGWEKFLDYAFLNKTTYVRVAGVPYYDELATFLRTLVPGGSFDWLAFVRHQPIALPLLVAVAALASAPTLLRADRAAAILLCLATAALLTLYPRADIDHVVPGVPGLLVVLLALWHRTRTRVPAAAARLAVGAMGLAVAGGLAIRLGASLVAMTDDHRVWCDLPHLRYVLMPHARAMELAAEAEAMRTAAASGRLFLLVPNAGLYYLVSGVLNPTPFDYPLGTAFGRAGEADLVRAISDGRLRRVCMTTVTGRMAAQRLQDAVVNSLRPAADLGACTLYTRPE